MCTTKRAAQTQLLHQLVVFAPPRPVAGGDIGADAVIDVAGFCPLRSVVRGHVSFDLQSGGGGTNLEVKRCCCHFFEPQLSEHSKVLVKLASFQVARKARSRSAKKA